MTLNRREILNGIFSTGTLIGCGALSSCSAVPHKASVSALSAGLPVVKGPWFSREPVDDRLTRFQQNYVRLITGPNLWRLVGPERDLVVDSGMGIVLLRQELPELFSRNPVMFISHFHVDHAGGAHEFDDVRVYQSGVSELQAPPSMPGIVFTQEMLSSPWNSVARDLHITTSTSFLSARPSEDYELERHRVRPVVKPRGMFEEDRIDLGKDVQFTVVHLPGHTHASAGLFNEKTGELFAGDVAYGPDGGQMHPDPVDGSIPDYLVTLEKLKEMDVRIAYGGHGTVLDGPTLRALADEYRNKWGIAR